MIPPDQKAAMIVVGLVRVTT